MTEQLRTVYPLLSVAGEKLRLVTTTEARDLLSTNKVKTLKRASGRVFAFQFIHDQQPIRFPTGTRFSYEERLYHDYEWAGLSCWTHKWSCLYVYETT